LVSFDTFFLFAAYVVLLLSAAYVLSQRRKMKRRGSLTTRTVGGRRIAVRTDWNRCMGAASCVEIAPKVFRIDWERKKSVFDPAPLEVLDENGADPETIFRAAQSCPYRAIILEDGETRERIFPMD
jgi:ferredoxin